MSTIQIVIFHSGRVERLRECLRRLSPLVGRPGISILVSDNSRTGTSRDIVTADSGFDTVLRESCPFPVHYNINREEADSDVSVFLHDDDWLLEGYIDAVRAVFRDPGVAAVSTNARIVGPDSESRPKTFSSIHRDVRVRTPDELFMAYFGASHTACPFSLYAYRTSALKTVMYTDEPAGKYSDVYFLANLLRLGEIHWCHEAHGAVGNFGDNDSHSEVPADRLRQFEALDRFSLTPKTRQTARRHIARKLALKAAADIYYLRRHPVPWRRYWSIAVQCI